MHMTMRKYRQLKGTPEDAAKWVRETLMPTLKKARGFKAYYAVAFDDGTIGSINVFEDEAAANEANKHVRESVGSSASEMLQPLETKIWQVLHEEHA